MPWKNHFSFMIYLIPCTLHLFQKTEFPCEIRRSTCGYTATVSNHNSVFTSVPDSALLLTSVLFARVPVIRYKWCRGFLCDGSSEQVVR